MDVNLSSSQVPHVGGRAVYRGPTLRESTMFSIDLAIALGTWIVLMLSMTSAVYQRRTR